MSEWHIYRKEAATPNDDIVTGRRLPDPPTWRDFKRRRHQETRGKSYKPSDREVEMVNAALYLRRPLLLTGNPGSGKSTLAYAVAWQLNLDPVLWWPINSRSTLQEGLYNYDALERLRDLNIEKIQADTQEQGEVKQRKKLSAAEQIGRYIRLGPLGTALYGGPKPRVLLIDEIDKSDIDLPNDLLHVLEEGEFTIPELQRLTPEETEDDESVARQVEENPITVKVFPHDKNKPSEMIPIVDGRVSCDRFPFIVLTSNGERELPPAFKRRCLNLDIEDPKGERLRDIVVAHIEEALKAGASPNGVKKEDLALGVGELIDKFEKRRDDEGYLLATDQLLNAIFLITRERTPPDEERDQILRTVLRELGRK
jgi:MoxR-like ATPase